MDAELSLLAAHALTLIPEGARLGLGSGRASEAFLRALAAGVQQGLHVSGVPTSEHIAELARSLGIPLDTLDNDAPLDLTVDGADEVERHTLNLIKGHGGALTRERIVAAAARRQVILVTAEKIVDQLGERGVVPVEVVPFAEPFCRRRIASLAAGLKPVLRRHDGQTFLTDNGNWILDCQTGPIQNTAALEQSLLAIPGVIDTGLFLGTASLVLLEQNGRVKELRQS